MTGSSIASRMNAHTPNPAPGKRLDFAKHLNPPQLAAVTAGAGPKLVIAGAGTGKTMTITYRVAYLLEQGVLPEHILLLTFTNKAAREMIGRVTGVTGVEPDRFWAGTFHSVANRILRREAETIGYGRNYSILDEEDSRGLVDRCISATNIDTKALHFPSAQVLAGIFSYCVNTRATLEDALSAKADSFMGFIEQIAGIRAAYVRVKRATNGMDFDDLLLNLLRLLKEHEEARLRYATRFEHVLVDEYQDTNLLQAELVQYLASVHGNLTVVGDDAQSIYRFRGATDANILGFSDHYEGAERFTLDINYRSTPQILNLANRVIDRSTRQYRKQLKAVRGAGPLPVVIPLRDADEQASFVCRRILELQSDGVPLSEIGVLYRAHYHSMELQLELTRFGLPYSVRSGVRFFEQAHVKDVVAYLRILNNPLDEMAWRRLTALLPGVGKVSTRKIWDRLSATEDPLSASSSEPIRKAVPARGRDAWDRFAKTLLELGQLSETGQVSELISSVISGDYGLHIETSFDNYQTRMEDLQELSVYAERFSTVEDFLSDLSLVGSLADDDVEEGDTPGEKLALTSVHQAKGLEWTVVFAIYLADGKFPAGVALREDRGEEEERRLFYVAATRAKQQLFLTYPLLARERGDAVLMKPSRFLSELGQGCYDVWSQRMESGRF